MFIAIHCWSITDTKLKQKKDINVNKMLKFLFLFKIVFKVLIFSELKSKKKCVLY